MHEPDDKPNAVALDLMARATIHRMQEDCAELAKLYATLDQYQRERLKALFGPDC